MCLRQTFNGLRSLVRKELQIFNGCHDCIVLQLIGYTPQKLQCFVESDFFAKLLHFLQQRLDLRLLLLISIQQLPPQLTVCDGHFTLE